MFLIKQLKLNPPTRIYRFTFIPKDILRAYKHILQSFQQQLKERKYETICFYLNRYPSRDKSKRNAKSIDVNLEGKIRILHPPSNRSWKRSKSILLLYIYERFPRPPKAFLRARRKKKESFSLLPKGWQEWQRPTWLELEEELEGEGGSIVDFALGTLRLACAWPPFSQS